MIDRVINTTKSILNRQPVQPVEETVPARTDDVNNSSEIIDEDGVEQE